MINSIEQREFFDNLKRNTIQQGSQEDQDFSKWINGWNEFFEELRKREGFLEEDPSIFPIDEFSFCKMVYKNEINKKSVDTNVQRNVTL